VLSRQIETHLTALRAGLRVPAADLAVAEQVAAALRRLVDETAQASAADRARVRAAVRYFVSGNRRGRRGAGHEVRVVNEILRDLGRADLAIA
jgi:hypothetical protein